ncbi:MAG: M10 family metallopeptidase [Novosphingobium sp.]
MKDNGSSAATLTHNVYVDSLLFGQKWVGGTITFAFPKAASFFPDTYPWATRPEVFTAAPASFQDTAKYWLEQVSSFTNLKFVAGSAATATLRWGLSSDSSVGAAANLPSDSPAAGDAYFGFVNYGGTIPGTAVAYVIAHELGHQLGLKHPHDSGVVSPLDRDSNEFTLMSYTQNTLLQPGSGIFDGGTSSPDEFAQTYMISDIAALQSLYGANFGTNAGDTVYTFDATGRFFVNGNAQQATLGSKIYRAIWDGGGNDTYDFSNFATNQVIDLRASGWSTISAALLGGGFYALDSKGQRILESDGRDKIFTARGNLANPDLYHGSKRSLIENAKAGSGDDFLFGNELANVLNGGAGNDALFGGKGADVLDGGNGSDTARYLNGFGAINVNLGRNTAHGGAAEGDTFVSIENVHGTSRNDRIVGNTAANRLEGFGGEDRLSGGSGSDVLAGGTGNDLLTGGAGNDRFVFDTRPIAALNLDTITDFKSGADTLAFALAVFNGFAATGGLSAGAFWSGAGVTKAHEADDRLVYDTVSGALWYDADGSGKGRAVEVAVLAGHPTLDYHDILIIA